MTTLLDFFNIARKQPLHYAIVVGSKASLTAERNKRTWELFSEVVQKECPRDILKRAQSRYRFKVSPDHTTPLLAKHIKAIQSAMTDLRRQDLIGETLYRADLLKQMPKRISPEKPVHKILGGVSGANMREILLPGRVAMDWKRLQLYSGIEKLKGDAYLQRLAMAIVSHPLEVGMLIPAPEGGGKKGLDYYEIVHLCGKDGMEVCALAPAAIDSILKPIILLQPTQFSLDKQGISTIINDLEPNLGQTGYTASKKFIEKVMKDDRFNQGDAILAAYSLGGNHAQRLLIDYPECFRRAVFFNDPFLNEELYIKKFAKKVNKASWKKLCSIRIYWNVLIDKKSGKLYPDWTSRFGKKHVGYGVKNPCIDLKVIELHYKTKKTDLKNRHTKRILDADPAKKHRIKKVVYTKKEAQQRLDNTKRSGREGWLETLREWGAKYFVYPLFHAVWSVGKSLLNFFLALLFGDEQSSASKT